MNIFKKNESKNENRLPMPDKVKRGFRYLILSRIQVFHCRFSRQEVRRYLSCCAKWECCFPFLAQLAKRSNGR